jgi:DNA-binding NarL/FixJ family response regulator
MAAAQRMSTGVRCAARCTFVVSQDLGSLADVDRALGTAGARVLGHGTNAEVACRDRLKLDAVVVVCRAVDGRSSETVRALRRSRPKSSVILVVGKADRGSLSTALQAGATGVVLRAQVAEALAPALEAAAAGQVSVPQEFATAIARPVLTAREKQILGMLVLGLTNGEIARKLHIAESTVKTHLSKVFPKLGVRSRSEAVAAILDPDSGLGTGILAISAEPRNPVQALGGDLAGATDGSRRGV